MPSHHNSIVHIIVTGVLPSTLLNLPLLTPFILSSADVVLHDSLGLSQDDIRGIVSKIVRLFVWENVEIRKIVGIKGRPRNQFSCYQGVIDKKHQ